MLLQPHHLVILLLVAAGRCLAASGSVGDEGMQFTYNGFAGVNLTLDGAVVMPNGLLMLTNGTIQTKGQAFHPWPLPFRTAPNATRSFSTTFVFAIFGQYSDLSSHGVAFFVSASKEVLSTALPSQFLGLLNSTDVGNQSAHIFAVELDTIFNAEFRDINSNHVGIDVNSLVSLDSTDAGYYDDGTGRFQNLNLISRKAMQVWVDYDGTATEITVTMAPLGMARPKKPLLQTTVDLSGVVQSTAYVGFSSSTGILTTRHFVVGWSFALDGPAPALDIPALPALPRAWPKPRSKVLEIVLPIASAALVLAVGIGIYVSVQRRLKYSELREDWEETFGPHRFSYKELFHATKGFSDKNLIGAGGFGSVYRGKLRKPADMEVAVKRVSHESRQGMKEFVAEIASIGRLRHRNLVPLLGYCRRKGELLLVYDVFAFGAFLLEITCGRRPIEQNERNNRVVLVDWVVELWRKGVIIDAVDTRIPDGFSRDKISLVLKLALFCSHPLANGRPTMRQVMQYLDGDLVLPDLSPAYLSFTMLERMYDGDFKQNMMPYTSSSASIGAISQLSGGR
ncbi:L-type lectin-domain containing receptor kinase SIT2-like isoform X2 [Lolium rigidum]|uniref:L-type lectin-domain containing receptor kinase SIT2-like isoform X2 n=1 Tax=Lolium rigidum TaxID=89674 RepID=UPI001F5E1011|nr:L-type lectin-domain containing receptor kinase SIT2-like isoform X2 [Lolium rigidum]